MLMSVLLHLCVLILVVCTSARSASSTENSAANIAMLDSHKVYGENENDNVVGRGGTNNPLTTADEIPTLSATGGFGDADKDTKFIAECDLPSIFGAFRMKSFTHTSGTSSQKGLEPIVLCHGDIEGKEDVLVRVHDQCFTSEVLGSMRCDCREQLEESLRRIEREGGVLIYLQQEGRGIGLPNKVAAYALQDLGLDTVDANLQLGLKEEAREYDSVPDILEHLGVKSIRLMTNNPYKVDSLQKLGVPITDRVSISIPANKYNKRYLESKRDRMAHIFGEHYDTTSSKAMGGSEEAAVRGPPRGRRLTRFLRRGKNAAPHSTNSLGERGGTSSDMNALPAASTKHASTNDIAGALKQSVEERIAIKVKGGASSGVAFPNGGTEDCGREVKELKPYIFGEESVRAAIAAIADGAVVCVVDDEDRENEGDLIMAADKATAETVGFMVRYTSGVICVSLTEERLEELCLPPMVVNNEDPKGTAYTVSVDAKATSTGISAADRAETLRSLTDPSCTADAFTRPGHVFPLRYKKGGVLSRMGHTEASLDLTAMAGLRPGGVLAEVVNDDGSMMRLESPLGGLRKFTEDHGLVLTSVQDIIAFRQRHMD